MSLLWNKKSTKKIGDDTEALAQNFLIKQGLTIVQCNYYCRFGEIDIIALDKNIYVFIEVKFRKANAFGGAISSITPSKQKKIVKTAQMYLQEQQLNEYNTPCRFDAVVIEGSINLASCQWLKNVF